MSHRMAGVDVHKKVLAVVVSDVEVDGQYQFEQRIFGCLLWRRRECGRELQPPVSERQSSHAARSQPGGQCRS
jgi:hypothetical protein